MQTSRSSLLYANLTRWKVFWLSTLLILLVAVGDQITSVEMTFTLLYAVVIAGAAWFGGVRIGLWLAALAAVCSTAIDLLATPPKQPLAIVWNELGLAMLFMMIAVLVERVHRGFALERAGRRLAVERLRHAERLNVIGTLAAGVAHEMGTPLNVISGTAELIEHARSTEEIHKMARLIGEQAERISAIIRHLLDFGRRAGSARTDVDLNELVRGGIELLATTARKRAAIICFEPNPARVAVVANRSEIEQVVSNLVLNAVQAMPNGGEVHVRIGETWRKNASGNPEPFAIVAVEDTGIGIAEQDLPRIFDPFFTTKGVGEGTGLGLSVSYGIVVDHHGHIEVESSEGRGTRFTVLLPKAADAARLDRHT